MKTKTNKRPVSLRSPPNEKQAKKARYPTTQVEEVNAQNSPTMNKKDDNTNEELKQTSLDKPEQSESDSNISNHHPTTEVKNTCMARRGTWSSCPSD